MKQFVGIVDTEGLDWFQPLEGSAMSIATIRAESNRQRHACVFIAEIENKVKDPIGNIKKCSNIWDMWTLVQIMSKNIKCRPQDVKTIKNIKKLADQLVECTGSAR